MSDLVTFGETMLRFSTPPGERLQMADGLDLHVGGAESNVAAVASRLGVDAAWLSKLPDSPLARRITDDLRTHDVTPLVARGEGRVGTYYLESGGEPRGTDVVYDREGAAIREATPDDLDLDAIREADAFYTSGITPALSDTLAETTRTLLETAQEADTSTVFDVNYRAKLWSEDEARETLTDLLPLVDLLVVAKRDAHAVLGQEGDAVNVAARLANGDDIDAVVVTRGAEGAVAFDQGTVHEQDAVPADTHDPIGSGDAFVGGVLARLLDDGDFADALSWGAAAASLKRTMNGDVAVVTPEEVEAALAATDSGVSR